nr:MAG TPA: tail fiber protein [Caudoviricetes sp.]
MPGKQVTELDALPSFTDVSLLPVHNRAGLKKGTISQLTDYMAEKFSNPNLLLNSNFRVDQRGYGAYSNNTTKPTYTLDRWMSINAKVVYNIDGTVTITSLATTDTSAWFKQILAHAVDAMCTLSCYITAVTGNAYLYNQANGEKIVKGLNTVIISSPSLKGASIELKQGASITIKWIKLEKGSKATTYVAPNYAEELQKCKMYYNELYSVLYGYITTKVYIGSEQITSMRTKPTITYKGSIWVYIWEKNFKYNLSSVGAITLTQYNEITIPVSPATVGQTCAVIFDKDSYIALDAEIYA